MKNIPYFNYAAVTLVVVVLLFSFWQNKAKITTALGLGSNAVADRIVSVDVVRILNGQRALASQLMGDNPNTESATLLQKSGNRANAIIREVAGPKAIVLVKQAVVSWPDGQLNDITDEVLRRLGLPEDAPTLDISRSLRVLPTQMAADQRMVEAKAKSEALRKKQERESDPTNANLIP